MPFVFSGNLGPESPYSLSLLWMDFKRGQTEAEDVTWDRVDLKESVIRLDPGETKTGEGRTLYLNEDLWDLWGEMRTLHGQRRLGCPYVFIRGGQRIRDFRESWKKACKEVGLWACDESKGRTAPSKLLHDLRRTAVRNMI